MLLSTHPIITGIFQFALAQPIIAAVVIIVLFTIIANLIFRKTGRKSGNKDYRAVGDQAAPNVGDEDASAPSTPSEPLGRLAIMDELRAALQRSETAALVGPGGVGKTHAARQLRREVEVEYPGRSRWITVADRPPEAILAEMGRSLGFPPFPADMNEEDLCRQLRDALKAQVKTLFVDDLRDQFTLYLAHCLPLENFAALITTRLAEPPDLALDAIVQLDAMTPDEARKLLADVPGLQEAVRTEPRAADDLAQVCGHHPLALCLAAARLRNSLNREQPLAAFVAGLKGRIRQLNPGPGAPASLEANLALNHAELAPDDQRRFRLLAVFASTGFSPAAAAAVWEVEPSAAQDAIARLQAASLLDDSPLPGRFRLHDLIRDVALAKLKQSEDSSAGHRRLAEYLIHGFDEHSSPTPEAIAQFGPELDNLRSAIEWAKARREAELHAKLATVPFQWFNRFWGINEEWEAWLTDTIALNGSNFGLQADAHIGMGDIALLYGDEDQALEHYNKALVLNRQGGDKKREGHTLGVIGEFHHSRGDYEQALAHYEQALSLCHQVGDRTGEAHALLMIGHAEHSRGEFDQALEHYEQALSLFRQEQNRIWEAQTIKVMGDFFYLCGDYGQAAYFYEQAISLHRQLGDRQWEAAVLFEQSLLAHLQDQPEVGERILEEAVGILQELGDQYQMAVQLGDHGWVLDAEGRPELGKPYLLRSAELFEKLGVIDLAKTNYEWAVRNRGTQTKFN